MQTSARQKPSRQLVIFLDAMEWDLVERWSRAGKLPTFRRLIEHGVRAKLSTTAAQFPDTVWPATISGMNPAKFEKYFYVQYDAKTLGLRHLTDDDLHCAPLWQYLSEAGYRVGVADMPKFPVSESIKGFQLTNWGAHAMHTARASSPAPLLAEIDSRFGPHPVGDCDAVDQNSRSLHRLRRRVLEGARLHGEVFRWLMQKQEWDIFFAGFSAPHCIGHHFWHFMDPEHPRHPAADDEGLADTIERIYRAVDEAIAGMLALVGPDTRVMLVASHGMGPVYHASWNLPEILDLLGYGSKPAGNAPIGNQQRDGRINPWRILKMIVPGALQYRIKAMLPQMMQNYLLFRWYSGGQTWQGRRAFAVPNNDTVGAIRISVKGRDLNGLVEAGDEYRRVCRDIREALTELIDPRSGRPVVRQVTLSHEEFKGPYLNELPDLTVFWENSFPWSSLHSPRFGTLRIRRQDSRSGSHTAHGFLLVTGPGVPPNAELTGRSIYDIAPTVLEGAGVAIPEEMDGRPLPIHRPML